MTEVRKPNNTNHVQFQSADLKPRLEARVGGLQASVGAVARRDLERYYALLERALRGVTLLEREALLLCDALNGTISEAHTIPLLRLQIMDAIELDGLDAKWGVDGPGLVEKLVMLDSAQTAAVTDAVERWWNLEPDVRDSEDNAGLRRVGLVHP